MGSSRGNFDQLPPGRGLSQRPYLPVGLSWIGGFQPNSGLLSSVLALIILSCHYYHQIRKSVKEGIYLV